MLKHAFRIHLVQLRSFHNGMTQYQASIARKIDIDHFDVGIDEPNVVLPRQFPANTTIAAFIMDSIDSDAGALLRIVVQMEHSQVSHQSRPEELADEAFIAVVGPDIAQYRHRVTGLGNVRKPLTILVVRIGNNALDVLHHRETERIGIKARKAPIVQVRLKHHVGMRLQEFEEVAVGNHALFVQPGHDAVMHIGRGALIHDLGLALRIKVLRDVPHDPEQFALPGLQARRRLLEEIQQVFLWQPKQLAAPFRAQHFGALGWPGRYGSPQIVECTVLVHAALSGALFLDAKIDLLLSWVTIYPVRPPSLVGLPPPPTP